LENLNIIKTEEDIKKAESKKHQNSRFKQNTPREVTNLY
jgi:hypothetical protein